MYLQVHADVDVMSCTEWNSVYWQVLTSVAEPEHAHAMPF